VYHLILITGQRVAVVGAGGIGFDVAEYLCTENSHNLQSFYRVGISHKHNFFFSSKYVLGMGYRSDYLYSSRSRRGHWATRTITSICLFVAAKKGEIWEEFGENNGLDFANSSKIFSFLSHSENELFCS
jgi:hypothetical protein